MYQKGLLPYLGVLSHSIWKSGRVVLASSLHRVYRLSGRYFAQRYSSTLRSSIAAEIIRPEIHYL